MANSRLTLAMTRGGDGVLERAGWQQWLNRAAKTCVPLLSGYLLISLVLNARYACGARRISGAPHHRLSRLNV